MDTTVKHAEVILDLCISAIQQKGRTVEDCLSLYPAQRDDLEPLLRTAVRLHDAPSPQSSAEFKAAAPLRLRQLATAHPQRKLRTWLPPLIAHLNHRERTLSPAGRTNPRLVPWLVGFLLVVLIAGGIGTASASAQALPGDILYPVKRAGETIQLTLTFDEASQASLNLEFANHRIDEAVTSFQQNRTEAGDQALADYNYQMQIEQDYLVKEGGLSAERQSVLANQIIVDVSQHQTSLAALIQQVPESSKQTIQNALSASQNARSRAVEIINNQTNASSTNPPPPPTATPTPTSTLPTQISSPDPTVTKPDPTSPPVQPTVPQNTNATRPASLPTATKPAPGTGSGAVNSPTSLPVKPTEIMTATIRPNPSTNNQTPTKPPAIATLPVGPNSLTNPQITATR